MPLVEWLDTLVGVEGALGRWASQSMLLLIVIQIHRNLIENEHNLQTKPRCMLVLSQVPITKADTRFYSYHFIFNLMFTYINNNNNGTLLSPPDDPIGQGSELK